MLNLHGLRFACWTFPDTTDLWLLKILVAARAEGLNGYTQQCLTDS